MLKLSAKVALIGSLLTASCPSVFALENRYNFDFRPAFVGFTLGGIAAGGVASLALMKSYKWASKEQGPKKYIGRTVLGATGLGTLLGLGYLMGYASKK